MGKRIGYGMLKQGFGIFCRLSEEIIQICEARNVPIEAIHRLMTPKRHATMEALAERILADWQAEQPKLVTNTILVPDLAPADLVAQAEKKIGLNYLDPSFQTWNFCQYHVAEGQPERFLDVRGKRYEVLIWKPRNHVTTQRVRDHFKKLGADGNVPVFIAWITETKPAGYCASIPSDDDLLYRDSDDCLYTPCLYYGDDAGRKLRLHLVAGLGGDDHDVFVAFREISS